MMESEDYADLIAINSSEMKNERKNNPRQRKTNIALPHNNQQPASNTSTENKKKYQCFKCSEEGHHIQDCEEFKQMSLDKRQDFVKKKPPVFHMFETWPSNAYMLS